MRAKENPFENMEEKYIKRAEKTNSNPSVIKYLTAIICSLVISLTITILGFILFLLSKDFVTFYAFAGLSVLAMIYHRPKFKELHEIALSMENNKV